MSVFVFFPRLSGCFLFPFFLLLLKKIYNCLFFVCQLFTSPSLFRSRYCRLVKCTRWSELSESLHFHAQLSEFLEAPSEFRLLNGADPILVGLNDDKGEGLALLREVIHAYLTRIGSPYNTLYDIFIYQKVYRCVFVFLFCQVLNESPAGPTPLCCHIRAIVREIEALSSELKSTNKKAAVIICTDGESSDGNVAEALRPLTDVSCDN
jgi:hypothetical protein